MKAMRVDIKPAGVLKSLISSSALAFVVYDDLKQPIIIGEQLDGAIIIKTVEDKGFADMLRNLGITSAKAPIVEK
jgi:hypothetical protein